MPTTVYPQRGFISFHALRTQFNEKKEEGWGVLAVDAANAFNCVNRIHQEGCGWRIHLMFLIFLFPHHCSHAHKHTKHTPGHYSSVGSCSVCKRGAYAEKAASCVAHRATLQKARLV
eukprot:GHVR01000861.1.p1 GENE.GHVR01000861.1~~GHVR01000861.1.p1  ORF type:complete len:117 (-),score=15.05 GHVR01000861.1:39-389(-)